MPQEFNFSQFETLTQILVNQAGYYGVPRSEAHKRADKYLAQLGLIEKKDKQARTLSGGMKRRLMIARALMHEPKLLILDEPTAGVDIELRRSMCKYLLMCFSLNGLKKAVENALLPLIKSCLSQIGRAHV